MSVEGVKPHPNQLFEWANSKSAMTLNLGLSTSYYWSNPLRYSTITFTRSVGNNINITPQIETNYNYNLMCFRWEFLVNATNDNLTHQAAEFVVVYGSRKQRYKFPVFSGSVIPVDRDLMIIVVIF